MTITLDLTPEQEQKIARRAAEEGQDVASFVNRLVGREIEPDLAAIANALLRRMLVCEFQLAPKSVARLRLVKVGDSLDSKFSSRDDIDQIYPVAQLRDIDAGHHSGQRLRQHLRADAEKPGLILIDAHAQRALRLDPVKADFFRAWVTGYDGREFVGDFANPHWLGTTHAVLQRPANRRPQFKRRQAADDSREFLDQKGFEAASEPLACFEALGDNDRLGKEIIRELYIERQVEPDGSLTYIGGPMVDIGVALQ